ncbi:MAG: aldo/keto reductase [Bacillota bacterium]|nr:aldo/keto reductase [Bacillota bacterium]
MQQRRLGKTGLWVSVIGFGGIPIITAPDDEAERVVKRAFELGVTLYDTARAYGRADLPVSASEDKIGPALRAVRDRVVLCTKTQATDAARSREHLEESLRRLATDYLDVWMFHAVDRMSTWETIRGPGGALETLCRAQEEGKVRYAGISGHRPDLLLQILKQHRFDVVMVPVNIVDRHIYGAEETLLPHCSEHDIGVLAMKPLAGGALKDHARLAIRYCLGQAVSSAVPGMGTLAEVETDVEPGYNPRPLSSDEEEFLWRKGRELGLDFCRQCGYCLPCTVGISIPTVFRLDGCFVRYGQEEWAREQYAGLAPQADTCAQCGDCETRCPYQLPIRDKLRIAHGRLATVLS